MLGAAIGGAAKRASEIFKEEAEAAQETVDDAFKVLVELGLPAATKRKQLRMSKEKIFDQLKDLQFSNSQIAVIMRQNRGQATLDHINKMKDTYDTYKVNPAEIATVTSDYDGDLTRDQVLENVMGKVSGGMNVSDATLDVTGKRSGGGLTGLFGGDAMAGPINRLASLTSATGVSPQELAAYASGTVTYDDPLVRGDVTLFDPLKPRPGQITQNTALRTLTKEAANRFGGSVSFDRDDNPRYENVILADQVTAGRYAMLALQTFDEQILAGKSGPDALVEASKALEKFDFTSAAAKTNGNGNTNTGMGIFKGQAAGIIPSMLEDELEGVTDRNKRMKSIAQATLALQKELEKAMPPDDAQKQANEIIGNVIMGISSGEVSRRSRR
jgi:hypothetical protein